MVTRRIFVIALLLSLGGLSVWSADVVTQTGRLSPFREVLIDIPGDVKLIAGASPDYTITAEPVVVAAISFKVTGQKLVVTAGKNFDTRKPVVIAIHLPVLAKLEANGSVTVASSVPTAEDSFELRMEGASDVTMGAIQTKSTKVTLTGSGTITMSGRSDKLVLALSGSADGKLRNLKTQDANVSISGSGDVVVSAARSLKAAIAGAGDIAYVGDPKVESNISGVGDVTKIN